MKHVFLAVDDEALALADLTASLKEAAPEDEVCAYTSPSAALKAVQCGQFQPDIAFLDIQMRGWTGLQLAGELRGTLPQLEIVFVTAHPQYALESYSLHARGYLMKPVTAQAVRQELDLILCGLRPSQAPMLLKGRNFLGVAVEKIDCDYYRLLQGDTGTIGAFIGEFMSQYSWAEPTTAALFYKYLQ